MMGRYDRFTSPLIFFIALSFWSRAEELQVIAYDPPNEPYSFPSKKNRTGIFKDIFKKLEPLTGDQYIFNNYPFARAIKLFDAGKVDIEPGINPAWRQHTFEKGIYSIVFERSIEVVVFVPGKKIKVRGPDDLAGKAVGMVRGYSYPRFDKAFHSGEIKRMDNLSETLLLEQLLAKRVNQVFVNLRTIQYEMQSRPEFRQFEVGDVVSAVDVMMRFHPSKEKALHRLNKGLKN